MLEKAYADIVHYRKVRVKGGPNIRDINRF